MDAVAAGALAARGPARVALEQLASPLLHADLVHFFDLTGPLLRPRRPFVATIHDASIMYGYRSVRHAYKRRLYPWAFTHARRVVAVSGFAAEEARRFFGVVPETLRVLHPGPGFLAPPESRDEAAGAAPDGAFLLYVGDLTARKNLAFLVRAFDRADVATRLVLAGRPGDGVGELGEAIRRARVRARISVVEAPSDAELDTLYRRALAVLLPSRYEGFGFTPLEAMARGRPVLASDIPAVREVSGDGALLVPVGDEAAWADRIRRIAGDERLRAELRARGAKTVARYSWTESARGLCRLFLEVGAELGRGR